MSPKKAAPKSTKSATASSKKSAGFTSEEKSAMKERAKELKAAASKADAEKDVLAKIAEMSEPERGMAKKLHALIKTNAPALSAKTWYGMPAYYLNDKVLCFFQSAKKFNTRYATLGFSDTAKLDEGDFWPNAYALMELTPTVEAKITALVKKAVS